MAHIAVIPLVVLLCLSNAFAGLIVKNNEATFTDRTCKVVFRDGALKYAENLKTGELYASGTVATRAGIRIGAEKFAMQGFYARKLSPYSVVFTKDEGKRKLEIMIERIGEGEFVIRSKAYAEEGNLAGAWWTVGGVDGERVKLIAPIHGGSVVDGSVALFEREFEYPVIWQWEFQLAIFQARHGGFAVWCEDPDFNFKRIYIKKEGGILSTGFEVLNHAPFQDKRELTSPAWHLKFYRGDWRIPASWYRDFIESAFLPRKWQNKPSWVRQIRAIVKYHGREYPDELLQLLKKYLIPEKTLIYIPQWRKNFYDWDYPDYTPNEAIKSFIEKAHEMGFRVMLHVNAYGVHPENPEYERFKKYHARDPFSGAPQGWYITTDRPYRHAFINPAYKPFRDMFVEKMVELHKELNYDALHIDINGVCINDANGPIDGLYFPQGTALLHKQLREALPDVGLGGEGVTEAVLAAGESWAQMWKECPFPPHSITTYLISPYTYMCGHLGTPNPDTEFTSFFNAYKIYSRQGIMPVITFRRDIVENAPRLIFTPWELEWARLWQDEEFHPDFTRPWRDKTIFAYKGKNYDCLITRTKYGDLAKLYPHNKAEKPMIVRYLIYGVNKAPLLGGYIPGHLASDGVYAYGLDRSQVYPVFFKGEAPSAPFRIVRVQEGFLIRNLRYSESFLTFSIAKGKEEGILDKIQSFRSGVIIDGEESPLKLGAVAQIKDLVVGGVKRHGLFMVMPWKPKDPDEQDYAWGYTFLDFTLFVPEKEPILHLYLGISDGIRGESDGAEAKIFVNGKEVFSALVGRSWQEVRVDLSKWRGKRVNMRLLGGPGPNNNVSWDLLCWGDINFKKDKAEQTPSLTIKAKRVIKEFLGEGLTHIKEGRARDGYIYQLRVKPNAPIIGFFKEGQALTVPCSLSKLAYEYGYFQHGRWVQGGHPWSQAQKEKVSCGGVEREAINGHPPNFGKFYIEWLLQLPEDAGYLAVFPGVADNSRTQGVGFAVLINGNVEAHCTISKPRWEEFKIPLTPYAGKTVLLTFQTDSLGVADYDWAWWGEPKILGQ